MKAKHYIFFGGGWGGGVREGWLFFNPVRCCLSWKCNYAPNFEKVAGAYWFRVVRPCIHSSKTLHARVLKFHIWIPHGKIVMHIFFFSCPSYLPIWSYAPLKKSEWNLMHAIAYEPCMLGFWNFIYECLMGFFSCLSYLPFWNYTTLKKSEGNLVSKISQKYLSLGFETWSADRGCGVDYLIKFKKKKKSFYFSGVMALWKFGHFKLVTRYLKNYLC